jgi:hypothetical protein
VHKPHASHQQHHHTSSSTNRPSLIPPSQISPHHGTNYMYPGHHASSVGAISPHQHYSQQRPSLHHNESVRNPKEPISIQEFMKQSVNEFVALTSKKTLNASYTEKRKRIFLTFLLFMRLSVQLSVYHKDNNLYIYFFSLDNDNKSLNSDLSLSENSTSQLSRILQPTTGTKSIDVNKIKNIFDNI